MVLTFILDGEVPAKKNSKILNTKTRHVFPNKTYRIWHDAALIQLLSQWDKVAVSGPCAVYVEFTHGDLRRRDSDNGLSSVLDLIVDAGILPDDNWRVVPQITVKNDYQKRNAKVVIKIIGKKSIGKIQTTMAI